MFNYLLFKPNKNIYKYIIFFILIIIYILNQPAFSDLMDESRRANQKSNDLVSLIAEHNMCQNYCQAHFKKNALENPSNANRIFDRCRSGCQESYQSKMSCIYSQSTTEYSPTKCNGSFRNESRGDNSSSFKSNSTSSKGNGYENNSSNTLSNIFWILLIIFGTIFLLKKYKLELFLKEFKNQINDNSTYKNIESITQRYSIKIKSKLHIIIGIVALIVFLASFFYLSPGFLYNYFIGRGFPSKENIKTAQFWVVVVVFWVIVYVTGLLAAEFEDAGKHIPTIAYLVLCVLISLKAKKIQNFLESKNIN